MNYTVGMTATTRSQPYVDLDAWSHNQITSKLHLCETLEKYTTAWPYTIYVLGGWYGVLPFMIRVRDKIQVERIISVDLDYRANRIADKVNNKWHTEDWSFKAVEGDANKISYDDVDPQKLIVINTSAEHFTNDDWFDNIPRGAIVAVQSTDMPHNQHIRATTYRKFIHSYPMYDPRFSELQTRGTVYTRFTGVGVR